MSCGCGNRCGPEFDPDSEGLSHEDLERFSGYDHACPCCGADIFHDAAVCPSCGSAIDTLDTSGGRRAAWVGAVAIVVVIAFVMVFVL